MKLIDAFDIVNRITYKPNVYFKLREHGYDNLVLDVTHTVPDVNNPNDMIKIHTSMLFMYKELESITKEHFIQRIRETIYKLELHEMDEWLCFDKKQLVNPHPKEK